MKKKKMFAAGVLGCFFLTAGIGMTFFCFWRQRETISAASMEPVRLEVCFLDEDKAYEKETVTGLLPGEAVERGTAVILDGTSPEACIRACLTFGGALAAPEEEGEAEREERLRRIRELKDGICFGEGWLEGGDGYYYYQKKVAPGSMLTVYERVVIPQNWDNDIAEQVFTIELSAEAVRWDHLEPWLLEGQAVLNWERPEP